LPLSLCFRADKYFSEFGIHCEDEIHVHLFHYSLENGSLPLNIDKYVTMDKEEYSTSWGESQHE